jgi:Amt family ammonium transporter
MIGRYQRPGGRTIPWLSQALQIKGRSWRRSVFLSLIILGCLTSAALAQINSTTHIDNLQIALDTLWVLIAGFLVFFMNAGFCMLETGFCRSKNAVNLLAKNLIVFGLSTVAFWLVGFALMFGDGSALFGYSGFLLRGVDNSPATGRAYEGVYSALAWAGVPLKAKFFFQLAFAGTAATIVSGAVAERIKFLAFFIFSLLLVGVSYPITGHWIWGGGFLADLGFWDFAGSTVVHSVGGWAALIGAILLGPRLGRYQERPMAMPGHNLSISALGCLILWLGWFGFNPGSTMAADPYAISHIVLTTNIAAALGGLAATVVSWVFLTKPDLSMIINGILAGLVAVTAPCAYVNIFSAALIGAVAGTIVVFSVTLLDQLRVDDPVGAISVHLVCGVWGTLAVGLFSVGPGLFSWYGEGAGPQAGLLMGGSIQPLLIQLLGILAVGAFTVGFSLITWSLLKVIVGIRVSQTEETKGLDLCEHAMEAYPEFNLTR